MPSPPQDELATDVQVGTDVRVRVILRGRLDAQTVPTCWNKLEADFRVVKINTLEVDASGLRFCDGAGFALLCYLNMGRMTPQATVSVLGLEAGLENIFRGFTSEDYEAFRPPSRMKCRSLPDEVGTWVRHVISDLREQVEFCGGVITNLPAALLDRRRMRWAEVRRVFELAGA